MKPPHWAFSFGIVGFCRRGFGGRVDPRAKLQASHPRLADNYSPPTKHNKQKVHSQAHFFCNAPYRLWFYYSVFATCATPFATPQQVVFSGGEGVSHIWQFSAKAQGGGVFPLLKRISARPILASLTHCATLAVRHRREEILEGQGEPFTFSLFQITTKYGSPPHPFPLYFFSK